MPDDLHDASPPPPEPTAEGIPLGRREAVAGGIDVAVPGQGVRLAATRWRAPGTPVLLLHGLASQRRFWNLVVEALAGSGLSLVALDQRGHGDSERPDGPYDVATCADDAVVALDALGIDRAVVVGHSWGATVALAVAARHPERTLAVAAIDGGTTSPGTSGPREQVRARLEPPRLALPEDEMVALFSSGPLGGRWSDAHTEAVLPGFARHPDGLARARLRFDLHMRVLDGLLDADVDATLAAVRAPAWVVGCEPVAAPEVPDDWARARAEGYRRAAALLASPRVLRWGGAVHDVPLQWPDLVAGLVRTVAEDAAAR